MADTTVISGRTLFLTRLAIGLIQGLALYFLYRAQWAPTGRFWPATNGMAYAPLLICWLFIPPLLSSALGEMRWQRAVAWALLASLVMAGLAFYDNWSAWPLETVVEAGRQTQRAHILPSLYLFLFGGGGLFIAHALIVGGHVDGRFQARYPTHFDIAWKLALQIALVVGFTGAFWLLLWLGAGLFALIKLTFFRELLEREWFAIPALSMAAAVALHLTDIRPALVRGARTLLLSLLSWLLPLPALIVTGFLASLPFTGLTSLWDTGHATAVLLVASAALLILINAAHQDGDAERMPPRILRLSGTLAALLPVPLTIIAAYALFLRVEQYGWTADRVIVAACVLVSGAYAIGYARAALLPGPWLARIESWNFRISLLVLAVLLALFTPLANPARIAVADQMARLEHGRVAPEKLDIHFLRWQGGRYGQRALAKLEHGPNALLRQNALAAERQANAFDRTAAAPALMGTHIIVYPRGEKLPPGFLKRVWDGMADKGSKDCLEGSAVPCELLLTDLDGDGRQEIMVFSENSYGAQVFRGDANGGWSLAGSIRYPYRCASVLGAFRSGRVPTTPPLHKWNDLMLGGTRITVSDAYDATPVTCPHVNQPSAH